MSKLQSAAAAALGGAAASTADGFLLLDAALFGFGDEPAFAADVAEDSAAGNDFAEAAIELLLRLVGT